MEKVSRRKFVATAAVAGTAAVLRPPAFAFENQGPGAGTAVAGPVDHEVVAPQASSFPMKNVKLVLSTELSTLTAEDCSGAAAVRARRNLLNCRTRSTSTMTIPCSSTFTSLRM